MRRKFLKKSKTPPPLSKIFMITLVVFLAMVGFSIIFVNKGIEPPIMDIAERKTTEFATRGINAAVRFTEDYDFEDVINVETNNEGYVSTMTIDQATVSEINRVSTDRVEEYFKRMNEGRLGDDNDSNVEMNEYGNTPEDIHEEDPTVVEIPIGMATGNTVLANLGPKVPVNLEFIGNVETDVITEQEEVGINGTLVTIYVEVEADVQVVIPFSSSVSEVNNKIYVAKSVIMGDVPKFYGGDGSGPSIAVPEDSVNENDTGSANE